VNRLGVCNACTDPDWFDMHDAPRIHSHDFDPILTDNEIDDIHGMRET
jgi:hypothetical protein